MAEARLRCSVERRAPQDWRWPCPELGGGVQERCHLLEQGWGLWGGGCALLSSANRMALNPQQDETDVVCLLGPGLLRQPLPDFPQGP